MSITLISIIVVLICAIVLLALLFPAGHPSSRRWRPALVCTGRGSGDQDFPDSVSGWLGSCPTGRGNTAPVAKKGEPRAAREEEFLLA